jgi:MYXO-CTERM domain-containing protein
MHRKLRFGLVLGLFLAGFSGTAQAALGDNAVGMCAHDGQKAFTDAIADLGLGWVRLDGDWWVLEPSQGNYQWGHINDAVQRSNAAGIEVFLTLAYTPGWVPRHGDTDGFSGNDVPNSSAPWETFVKAAVTHFRALGVRHFGIWNEPNLQGFWEGTLTEYVNTILLPGAGAVRSVCNDCFVLGPDLANVGDCDVYLENLLAAIPVTTFDIFTHHIYQGFPETGVNIWDGDRYFEVLDSQRFAFTRKDIRQILDAAGYSGEVWITETGKRATPGDDAAEQTQAKHITLALDEQLKRGWVTNTFIYEMHDCGPDMPQCTIDGYGLMRATGGSASNRVFPTDFRLKPAYHALKQYVLDHPQFAGAPSPQCGDGVDNDGDGWIDLDDRGCENASDDDESDDPARSRLVALPAKGATVDGHHEDFGGEGWIDLGAGSWVGTSALAGSGDLAVRVAARWDDGGLLVGFEVTDDVHDNDNGDAQLWMGDSVQIGFDVDRSYGSSYDDVGDHEINIALVGGEARFHRFHGPAGATNEFEVAAIRDGQKTRYEVRFPPSTLPSATWSVGESIGFSFLVNDADGQGREGWMEWTPGIGTSKVPYYFGEILLSDGKIDSDAGTGGTGGVGGSGGTGGTGGSGDPDGGVAGSGGVGPEGGVGGASGSTASKSDDGCGCSTPGRVPTNTGLVGLLLVGLLGWRRRHGDLSRVY